MIKKEDLEKSIDKLYEKEIFAYSLKNAIEFGKAEESKILPKLFAHGLGKQDIGKIMPAIKSAVSEVNKMSEKIRKMQYGKYKQYVKEKEEKEKERLPDLDNVSGKPVFRVAPFPSGALHIGNAKTFLLNAMYAEKYSGTIKLMMDDTIGSVKKPIVKESYDLIEEALKWLGIKYSRKVYYKSDRMKTYYEYAEKMIKKDVAYVCHCSQEELRKKREKGMECACRQFPKDIQMKRWKQMFKTPEGQATLRIKTDMKHPNPAFRDRVLFKISDREHPRTKKKYRVWPTLEMSWAVDDHLLKITHIIRGNDLTIETDMEKFIWDVFGWKHPEIIHTGLVNLELGDDKISKSKAQKEVKSGKYSGWDDPRTWSIQSLKRRGILSESLRLFVRDLGLNKQDITVPIESLYAINRRMIDSDANRYYFVEDPVKIKVNHEPKWQSIGIPIHPEKEEKRVVKVDKELFIPKKDFNELKGKEVRLLHLFNIKLDKKCEVESEGVKRIPKIQWVNHESVQTRILMPNGKWISGLAEKTVDELKQGELIQFERFGFVRFDQKKEGVYDFWFTHK